MKAFRADYSTPSRSDYVVVLAKSAEYVEEAVANKVIGYRVGKGSVIVHSTELQLSNVMVSDLSVAEMLLLMKENI